MLASGRHGDLRMVVADLLATEKKNDLSENLPAVIRKSLNTMYRVICHHWWVPRIPWISSRWIWRLILWRVNRLTSIRRL